MVLKRIKTYWLIGAGVVIILATFGAIGIIWNNVGKMEQRRYTEHINLANNIAEMGKNFILENQFSDFYKIIHSLTQISFVEGIAVFLDGEKRLTAGEQKNLDTYWVIQKKMPNRVSYVDVKHGRLYVNQDMKYHQDKNASILTVFSLREFQAPIKSILLAFGVIVILLIVLGLVGLNLVRTNLYLEYSEATKSNMIRAISHDAMHYLSGIYSQLYFLLDQKDGNVTREVLKTELGNIRENTHALKRVLENLKENERLSKGEVLLLRQKIDLTYWIQFIRENVALTLAKKEQKLQVANMDRNVYVLADKEMIKTVLMNLLDNAIKYSAKGTMIKIWIETEETIIKTYIQDRGRGIAAEDWDKLFKPFVRLIQADEKIEGSGLGLSNARQLIRLHGGELKIINSQPGKGTTFCFSLPRA